MLKPNQIANICSHLRWARNFASTTCVKQKLQSQDSESILHRLPACQMPNMMDIGSRSIFDEDHDIFRSSVRRFFREEVAPEHKRFEEQVNLCCIGGCRVLYIPTEINTVPFKNLLVFCHSIK